MRASSREKVDLRHFLADRLADFKVPRQIVVLSEIPEGPSGKVQRSGLAEKLGFALGSSPKGLSRRLLGEHQGVLHQTVARIWRDVLRLDNVASEDNFFELGGDSIKVTQVVSRLCHELKTEIPFRLLFEYPSFDMFAEELGKRFSEDKEEPVSIRVD